MRRFLVLVFIACAACAEPQTLVSHRVVQAPDPTPWATIVAFAPPPTPARSTTAAAVGAARRSTTTQVRPVLPALPVRSIEPFRQLGSWIDVYDYTDDPATIVPLVRGMAAQGVRTLYLETSRSTTPTDIQYPTALGAALDEAKTHGMRVVAWYPPAFDDLSRDVRRSLAAIRFMSPAGHRFDAFGADIEYRNGIPDDAARTKATIEYSQRLRAQATVSALAAITIAPTSLEAKPDRWPGYPWKELGELYDVIMPMNYWTAHGKDPQTASDLTEKNVTKAHELTGRPVHVIGGLAADADEAQVAAYVSAAKRTGSIGGGLYDYKTTRPETWDELRGLN